MSKIIIPKQAITYIILQRTEYLTNNATYTNLGKLAKRLPVGQSILLKLQASIFGGSVARAFEADIKRDYDNINGYLPANATRLLDIGSGIGGIDIFLSRHYAHKIEVNLLDKTKVEETIYYGFEDSTPFYNSLEIAKDTLLASGVPTEHIILHDADIPTNCFGPNKYDLITSFISWGFHYPVSTYIEPVKKSLTDNGVLIIDVRKESGGLEEIKKHFADVQIIFEEGKLMRLRASEVSA
ncbi:hypothetical protein CO026_02705 [Candidatus Kaiserbacteria bacterium CG_4_9_14_0_2_um_filter_41_32]|uniref:Methyltransferase type 11 domain-containing protein n=2 Tax=Patescibacteria group TaxID=1783273 RepID=A0A2M8FEC9_9BACT|nr:MAG: hypothetical protein COV58_03335 [Candidatus Roizmanbacteria bacterium CG11_big_fil_rev_8_21_14_0_20_36_8]PJC55990.1 MAG: hypothetical protein CO026_02705 [Candidatus Kaiserbacteria bacterium CG_4_9_14_0_2_um_filter_41_32]